MKQELIEALKKNEKPYMFLTEEERAFIEGMDIKHLICAQDESTEDDIVWGWGGEGEVFSYDPSEDKDTVFRLRPDYEMEADIVECDRVYASTGDAKHGDMNNVVGVTAHCKCGNVFCDDVVHCKIIGKIQEPEIAEYYIYHGSRDSLWYNHGANGATTIDTAMRCENFIGFKYEDGRICSYSRLYRNPTGELYGYIYENRLKTGEVLAPTHVLFKRSK